MTGKKALEKGLYEPIRKYLESKFSSNFGYCYLEITANGHFSEGLKRLIRHDIVFSVLRRRVSPDLTGFATSELRLPGATEIMGITLPISRDFITAEVKRERITVGHVAQAKLYGDLLSAKYALLISSEPIPEEIKRLHKELDLLSRFMSGWKVHIGQLDESISKMKEDSWFPKSPY